MIVADISPEHADSARMLMGQDDYPATGIGQDMAMDPDAPPAGYTRKHAHYFRDVSRLREIDVYRVLELFNVIHPSAQHAIKKLMVAGQRGAKDVEQDVREAGDTVARWLEMIAEDDR